MTDTMTTGVRPLPEALGRGDIAPRTGEWRVNECAPVRGVPVTSVEDRFMRVPMGNDKLSEIVRVHELVHAKVSPRDLRPWVARGIASEDSMRAVEEMRVNYLASTLGYDMNLIVDGSETQSGEHLAKTGDWRALVLMTMALAGTGGIKKFLTGVRRHNRVWGNVLNDIAKKAMKEMKRTGKEKLASTNVGRNGLPIGFSTTERIAEWADRMAGEAPAEKPSDDKSESGGDDTSDKGGDDEADTPKGATPTKKRGRPKLDDVDSGEASKKVRDSAILPSAPPSWMSLKVERLPLPEVLGGAIGKKRVASQVGKNPRRLHRLLTDPQKRVFDRVVRGKGGVVVIDASGSMSLSREQIREVVLSAPGCTVLTYTCFEWDKDENGEAVHTNAWVLADNGRICDEMPFSEGSGNGVDLPALEWAVAHRQRSSTPIVWVSDMGVSGMYDSFHDALTLKCVEYCERHNIVVVPDTTTASKYLTALANGERMKVRKPSRWKDVESKYLSK